jgi:nitronate monooxygenase
MEQSNPQTTTTTATSDELVAGLNELLEAERAGVATLARLRAEAAEELIADLRRIGQDEAWSCAGLHRSIKTLGGEPSDQTGDFADKVMALEGLAPRLELLSKGQVWVARRLSRWIATEPPEEVREFLSEMLRRHEENIAWCDERAKAIRDAG